MVSETAETGSRVVVEAARHLGDGAEVLAGGSQVSKGHGLGGKRAGDLT